MWKPSARTAPLLGKNQFVYKARTLSIRAACVEYFADLQYAHDNDEDNLTKSSLCLYPSYQHAYSLPSDREMG